MLAIRTWTYRFEGHNSTQYRAILHQGVFAAEASVCSSVNRHNSPTFSLGLTWGLNWLRDGELRAQLHTQQLGCRGPALTVIIRHRAPLEGKKVGVKCMPHTSVLSGRPESKIHAAPGPHPAHGPQPWGFLLLPMSLTRAAALGPSPRPVADPLPGMLFRSPLMAGLYLTFSSTPLKLAPLSGLCSGSASCHTAAGRPFASFTAVTQSIIFRSSVLAWAPYLNACGM